ncbi:MAG: EamA family transporter [Clostridia bacterium]|nr:EamA family transporter [Clostridia bacterium]
MPYLFLTLALVAGLTKGFAGKRVSRDVTTLYDGFTVNTLRTLFCAAIGLCVALYKVGIGGLALSPAALLVACISSLCMALFSISWLYAYKSEAYVFLSLITMLASVVTALLGHLVYGDALRPVRLVGFALLLPALYVMSLYNRRISGRITPRAAVTLLLGGLGAALSDFMQRVYTKEGLGEASVFTFYTYFLMLVPQLAVLAIYAAKKAGRNPALLDRRHVSIFLLMSVALYANVLFKTLAAGAIPATQMYPTLQAANLISSAILASLLFGERITRRSALGILIALAAILFMNLS